MIRLCTLIHAIRPWQLPETEVFPSKNSPLRNEHPGDDWTGPSYGKRRLEHRKGRFPTFLSRLEWLWLSWTDQDWTCRAAATAEVIELPRWPHFSKNSTEPGPRIGAVPAVRCATVLVSHRRSSAEVGCTEKRAGPLGTAPSLAGMSLVVPKLFARAAVSGTVVTVLSDSRKLYEPGGAGGGGPCAAYTHRTTSMRTVRGMDFQRGQSWTAGALLDP